MGKFFICYRREDSPHFAGRIVDQLRQRLPSEDVFIDNSGVRAGTRWQETLAQALVAADCVLVVIGPQWLTLERNGRSRLELEDDWVRSEIRTALKLRKRVVPVLEEGTRLPEKAELPADIQGLLDWQVLRIRNGHFAQDCRDLLTLVKEGRGWTGKHQWIVVAVLALFGLSIAFLASSRGSAKSGASEGSSGTPRPALTTPPLASSARRTVAPPLPSLSSFELLGEPTCVNGRTLEVTFFDVGQGDATLFQLGKTEALVDVGDEAEPVAAMQSAIFSPLEYLFISHAHLDHYGAAPLLLPKVRVQHAVLSSPANVRGWIMMLNALKEQKATIESPVQGQTIEIAAGFGATTLSAGDGDPKWSVNNQSIVQRFDYCGRRVLMTGDIEPEAQEWLVAKYCKGDVCPELRADVLKFPWHGSDHFSRAFLKAVDPEQAVISAGAMSKYHVPSERTIEVLKELGVQIFSTSGEERQDIKLQVKGGSSPGFPCYDHEHRVWKQCEP